MANQDSRKLELDCHSALESLPDSQVLVIGDLMWDEYIRGDALRVSPEAPVPVVLMEKEERTPGGAFNVVHNLFDLQVKCGIAGVTGNDENGRAMADAARAKNAESIHLWQADDRPTTIKTRIIARNQQLLRVDREYAKPVKKELEEKILSELEKVIPTYKSVILSDYDKGMLTQRVITGIIEICQRHNVFVAVDPQVRHFKHYKNAGVMTPNEKEASDGIGMQFPDEDKDAVQIGLKILKELQLKILLLTRSAKGMILFETNPDSDTVTCHTIPTVAREVFDVTGAGDTVISVYTALIASGTSALVAALLANIAGGVVVGRLGTATVTADDLKARIDDDHLKYRTFTEEMK
ncbi:MAG: D-glycero-beta-D-manno-heptose-7-phosphate kinase [Leptospiraceae bacterium]|nr:D-glycero-beta-D-manno-heptose-7-phosphate kinase [Leptospiraceae bacterium]